MKQIRIAVAGPRGRMGQESVKMIIKDETLRFVCGIDPKYNGEDVGEVLGLGSLQAPFVSDIRRALEVYRPDVLVDFTTPHVVKQNMIAAIEAGVRPVVGTTGFTPEDIEELDKLCREHQIGGIIAPNFAIGAVLMMKFAQEAAKYMPHVEIIELHHDKKLDAPSGTAVKTAEMIQAARDEIKQGHPEEKETLEGARGGYYGGFRIHSVRLPGLVAHQEVIFGAVGQTLTIRHDSINRESFMPGVNLAIKKVMEHTGLIYGLENIMV
ncbi:4-hydroxy-tetrahydrodipicolinate reductase [Aneurinibacillus thermoaerophilus]|uniref:4-hydroxy-tetrahydrodipicolinate reductase n=1 Tax=Aneurinibacillus thermoaerophilus TaxID=143495 RepID=A0ABX8YEI4_ANETH|nr:4-hydroxy-tetrahydrodipicolinate reductase [Aneurinibacillus thermoaerophilus]QYY43882.1 4-hydroxy-tetrahydrodipicolinate reductase [Aneurinibacillus thermoaerophilus]